MRVTTIYQDDFTGGTVMRQYAGNGSIAFPGTVGRLTCPNGAYCEISYNGSGAPILYDMPMRHPARGILFEARLAVFSGSTNARFAPLILATTPTVGVGSPAFYSYQIGYYKAEGQIIVDYYWPSSGARLFSSGAVADPVSTPHLYRVYWNPSTERNLWIPEFSVNLGPDQLLFAYSVNGGTSWVTMGTRARDFTPSLVGVTVRKWETTAVNATADYDYFLSKEYDASDGDLLARSAQSAGVLDSARIVPVGGLNEVGRRVPGSTARSTEDVLDDAGSGPTAGPDTGGFTSDATRFLPAGGGADFLLYSDPRYDAGWQEKADTLGVLEDALILQHAGGPRNHNAPEGLPETRGLLLNQLNHGALEDVLLCELQGADWQDDVLDPDGRETLGAGYLSEVLLVDTTAGTFGTPGLGHYGAARNGRFYDAGDECVPAGNFGTMSGGLNRLSWRFTGEEPFGWPLAYSTLALTADDTLTLGQTGAPSWGAGSPRVSSDLKWVILSGDFDIQVDFSNYASSGDEISALFMIFANVGGSGGSNNFQIQRRGNVSGGRYETAREQSGSWVGLGTSTTSDVSGKMRIARVSGVLYAYRWTGSAWAQVGSSYTHASVQGDVGVWLSLEGSASRTGSVKFSAFTMTTGSTSNRVGWWREAAGAERGSMQDMPTTLAVVATQSTLDLLDYDTGKLWMGFNTGSNYLLHGGSGARPRRATWVNGLLLLAYGTEDWTTDGGALLIDFTLDRARIHRLAASAICGGFYCGSHYASGALLHRNAGKGYVEDYDDWAVKTYGSRSVAAFDARPTGKLNWAVGGGSGLEIFRSRPENFLDAAPNPENTYSIETPRILSVAFDGAGQVFYLGDDATLYSAPKVTWEAGFDGFPFAKQYFKLWPGSTSRESQRRVVLRPSPTRVYAATEAGVYVSEWPGAWSLLYGRAGTGALHEVLPFYDRVAAVAYAKEGAEEYLLCSLQAGVLFQLAVVDLSTNALWAVSPIESDGRTSVALGVLS